jgi:endonuclease/exonuclease/phosphatase family metal-dependent hydrolase
MDKVVIKELGLRNPFAHLPPRELYTWHARRPVFNLDRIYVRHMHVHGVRRFHGAPWDYLSDHLPLWAEMEVDGSHKPVTAALRG